MQFIIIASAAFTAASPALKRTPSEIKNQLAARQGSSAVCPADDTPQCCQLNALGVLAVTCSSPGTVANATDFEAVCADGGASALCCTVPVAGLGLLCTAP